MNRGSLAVTGLGRGGRVRFNEAPIHESGKSGYGQQETWGVAGLQ